MPHTKESILNFLQNGGYCFELTEHAAMHTIDDMMAASLDIKGEIVTNFSRLLGRYIFVVLIFLCLKNSFVLSIASFQFFPACFSFVYTL